MRRNFLRPPRTVSEWAADAVRVLGLIGIVVAAIGWQVTDAGIVALATPALMLPRFIGVTGWFDLAYGVTVLVATWSNVLGLYESIDGWDLVVHFACTGIIAVMLFELLVRLDVIRGAREARRIPLVLVPALGLAVSAVWEMIEWLGKTYVSDEIFVAYDDTIGDMTLGGLGALAAAILLFFVRVDRRDAQNDDHRMLPLTADR